MPAPVSVLSPLLTFAKEGETIESRNFMDGREFLGRLRDGAAAAAFFDPQYRGVMDKMGYGNEGQRQRDRAKLQQMPDDMIAEFIAGLDRAIRPSGHVFLWVDKFHLCEGVSHWTAGTGFSTVDLVTWNKGRIGMGYRTRRKSEYLIVLQKAPNRAKGVWTRHDIPDVVEEKIEEKRHAHQKPLKLQALLVAAVTKPGDLIIDPAAGSFSVERAVQEAGQGRIFAGADLLLPHC